MGNMNEKNKQKLVVCILSIVMCIMFIYLQQLFLWEVGQIFNKFFKRHYSDFTIEIKINFIFFPPNEKNEKKNILSPG